MHKLILLETTLRDGSYAIDFQFTASDTTALCKELDDAGFPLIEIGHGIGLGATRRGLGRAVESDESYMKAAAQAVKHAKWGMFAIPGIATLEDVDIAGEHGMPFIRLGTNVTEVDQAAPFIERAKKYGMYVSTNFMKSYAMPPAEFAEKAKLAQRIGADVLCIVDSAGGMLTSEMESYFRAVQDACDIPLGFHGHNNLELAVANSIRALELGAQVIDTSLQGLGRSAGNTPTEIYLVTLERLGVKTGINFLQVMDIGEKYVKPLVSRTGYDSVDIISGFSLFHSSYMGIIRECSSRYRIDPRRLIMALCEVNKMDAPKELVEAIAKQISEEGEEVFTARFRLDRYHGAEQEALPGRVLSSIKSKSADKKPVRRRAKTAGSPT